MIRRTNRIGTRGCTIYFPGLFAAGGEVARRYDACICFAVRSASKPGNTRSVSPDLTHVTDWFPILVSAPGCEVTGG